MWRHVFKMVLYLRSAESILTDVRLLRPRLPPEAANKALELGLEEQAVRADVEECMNKLAAADGLTDPTENDWQIINTSELDLKKKTERLITNSILQGTLTVLLAGFNCSVIWLRSFKTMMTAVRADQSTGSGKGTGPAEKQEKKAEQHQAQAGTQMESRPSDIGKAMPWPFVASFACEVCDCFSD